MAEERKPHTCPVCEGKLPKITDCAACAGTGVVWEPQEAVASPEAPGDLDLTYRKE